MVAESLRLGSIRSAKNRHLRLMERRIQLGDTPD
jgi:hypothetical protein